MASGAKGPAAANPESVEAARQLIHGYFRMSADPALVNRDVRRWLWGIPLSFVLMPAIFWLRFGEVGLLGWGSAVFFAVYCLLSAIGLHFFVRADYHTPVRLKKDWIDRVGAFWLVACALGPFLVGA